MRIGFIEDTHLHGGTQIWVSEAIRDFLAKGHEVVLLTPTGGFNAEEAAKTKAALVTYDYDDVVSEDPANRRIWTDALAQMDVAVCTVHPPRDRFHCSVFAGKCLEAAGLDTVLIPKTGTIVPEYKREFYLPSEKIRCQPICITNFTREYLIDTYEIPAEIVSLVYQGTQVDLFTSSEERRVEAQQRYSLREGASPVLGCLGSFEERKGQVVLLEAIARVRERLPNVHLMLVGDGPDEAMLKQKVVDMDLGTNVTFFPFTREPVYIYEVLDAVVLSSLNKEGLPNVLLESLAMGVPVVSSRMAGVPECVIEGETGVMVPPGDADALADAIAGVSADPAIRRRMGQAGRRLMEEKFDKNRQFDRFIEHFQRVSGS
jgi:glycosyltransferase involved in cell wall biosynthesis